MTLKVIGLSYGAKKRSFPIIGPKNKLRLEKVGVDRSMRHQGFANQMMQKIIRDARKDGLKSIEVLVPITNDKAQGFYSQSGFTKSPRGILKFTDKIFGKFSQPCEKYTLKL